MMSTFINNLKTALKTATERLFASALESESDEKSYGNQGENEFFEELAAISPEIFCKKNIILEKAEIDALLFYENKVFAVEIKNLKGSISGTESQIFREKDGFQEEIKNPFQQIKRAIYILKKSFPNVYINEIVYFHDAENVSVKSDKVFDSVEKLADYIRLNGKPSDKNNIESLKNEVSGADILQKNGLFGKRSEKCVIDSHGFCFSVNNEIIEKAMIRSIIIKHSLTKDDLLLILKDGRRVSLSLPNFMFFGYDGNERRKYAFAKIDCIETGI